MIDQPSEHTVLVTGATGQQGGAVARHLLAEGFRVRAMTRDASQEAARTLADAGMEVVEGDFADRASLDRALDGAYGAYSVQNTWAAGVEGEVAQGKAFADAARDAGVGLFVYSSVASADRDTGIPHFESKWEIEQYLRALDLPVAVLRPVFFMDNWQHYAHAIRSQTLPQPLSPETSLQQIAVDDIGLVAAQAFRNPDAWPGRTVALAGDELTMAETATTFGQVLGREVEYLQVPWEAFEEQAGEEMAVMYRWFEDVGYDVDVEALREEFPSLKRLDPFLRAQDWTGPLAPET